jgi:CelD/BcsL family acetyltransferase involved in cellulose biosynthesis
MRDEHNTSLRTEVIYGREALLTIGKDWDELFERSLAAPPFLSRAWVTVFVEEGKVRGTPLFALAWSGPKLVAILPLAVRQSLWVKIAEPIGTGLHTYLGLLSDPNYPQAIEVLSKFFKQEKVADVLYINDLSSEDEATGQLLTELAKNGFLYLHVYRNPCHYIKLGCSFDEYLSKTISARRRRELKRNEKKVLESGAVDFEEYSGNEVSSEVITRMANIQEGSWMKRRGAAILGQPFYCRLLAEISLAGLGRVWFIKINGSDAAFGFGCIAHNRFYYQWTAFQLNYESSLSVGKVLTMWLIREACNKGLLSFDFGHGDGEYKRFWATNSHDVKRAAAGRGLRGYVVVLWFGLIWWLAKHQWIRAQYRRIRANLFGS